MSGCSTNLEPVIEPILLEQPRWYAIQTRPRHEKKVATELTALGITHYLPLVEETHRWSDRKKVVEVPLFTGYTFVNITQDAASRLSVLRIYGVLNFVGTRNLGQPIPDTQIEDVRLLLKHQIPLAPYPFLKIGQRVRIRGGALEGMEGILVGRNGSSRLVISIDSIERSLAMSVQGYDIEPV